MSLLPAEVHTALSQLLRALSTPDNTVRSQAEDQLNNDWVQNRPDVLLMGLAEQLGGAEETLVSWTTLTPGVWFFEGMAVVNDLDPEWRPSLYLSE
jgi:hypothetical protein